MNRGGKQMEKEKRGNKKKGGKKILAAAACIGLLAAAGGFFFWQKSNADAAEGAVVIEAGENGEIIYAQIDNIVGSDIDVSIMEETASGSGNTGQNVSGQNAVEPGNGGQEISGRENGAWDMPDGMPQGMPADMSDGTPQGMPDGAGVMGDVGDEGGNSTRNSTRNSTKGSTGNNAGSVSDVYKRQGLYCLRLSGSVLSRRRSMEAEGGQFEPAGRIDVLRLLRQNGQEKR